MNVTLEYSLLPNQLSCGISPAYRSSQITVDAWSWNSRHIGGIVDRIRLDMGICGICAAYPLCRVYAAKSVCSGVRGIT
eukprot:scaffold52009_cov78-Cyclotella_meneghiniana.AAC.1